MTGNILLKKTDSSTSHRFDGDANHILYYTSLYTAAKAFNSGEFTCKGVADRSGNGDCFMAGLIYGMYNKHAPQELLKYASADAFGKLQELGDATGQDVLTVSKIEADHKTL